MSGSRRTRHSRILAVVIALLLLPATTSCGNMDDIMDEAKDVLDEAGDVVDAIRGDGDDGDHGSTSESEGSSSAGGQTVVRPPRPTGTIVVGEATPLTSGPIDANGGTITVQQPGDPLDGLEIQVPPGAYPDSRQFEVSSAPVNGHTFGQYFTPATPLISIENGGDYADEFITARIPVEIPADHFAMAFYYDGPTATLEGIPLSAMDEHSITIVTRHFCDIIVSIVSNSVLDDLMKSDIDSHFRPGIDDWQFENNGSYISPGGHCAGQSISAMWYFCEQPDGQDLALNGRYDKNGVKPATPDLWQDDSHAYRFASTVQLDADWSSFGTKLQVSLRGADDDLQFKAFAYAIQLTGEPQYAGITSSSGGGHAMVAYRVHKNSIYIADPNYPGRTDRRIEYTNAAFEPYESGANKAEIDAGHSTSFDRIGFMGKSSVVDWTSIGVRWNEFKAGTIGNDRFPAYQIVAVDSADKETPLVDGYESKEKKIGLDVTANPSIGKRVYRDGNRLEQDDQGCYELNEGNNLIGIDIWGDVNNNPQDPDYHYIDFQYFNIQYGEEECHGWVLDSIEEKEYYVGESSGDMSNYVFEASSNGTYVSSMHFVLHKLEEDFNGDFSASGAWTPLPDCIRPNEPVQLELRGSTSVVMSEAAEWGNYGNYLTVESDAHRERTLGGINHTVTMANPTMEDSTIVEFELFESEPGLCPVQITIRCSTMAGGATYVYTYVWQD